jgi:signal transduction histidine kinase
VSGGAPRPSCRRGARLSEQLLAQDIELIKREERLTLVERLKADLIETMSYELRQPLNSMIERMISVLANEHEALSVSGRDSLRGVLADGNTLMQMLQNILDCGAEAERGHDDVQT